MHRSTRLYLKWVTDKDLQWLREPRGYVPPGWEGSLGENGYTYMYGDPLQYSCLENPTDRGAGQATVHGVARVGRDLATKPAPPHVWLSPFTAHLKSSHCIFSGYTPNKK